MNKTVEAFGIINYLCAENLINTKQNSLIVK